MSKRTYQGIASWNCQPKAYLGVQGEYNLLQLRYKRPHEIMPKYGKIWETYCLRGGSGTLPVHV